MGRVKIKNQKLARLERSLLDKQVADLTKCYEGTDYSNADCLETGALEFMLYPDKNEKNATN